jgi:hypothetical protein
MLFTNRCFFDVVIWFKLEKKMSTFEKLRLKILKDTGYDLINFKKTYAGQNQLQSWAWTWTADFRSGIFNIGSSFTAKELLSRDKIEISEDRSGNEEVI